MSYTYFETPSGAPFGRMRLTEVDGLLVALDFDSVDSSALAGEDVRILAQTRAWLAAYFAAGCLSDMPDNMLGLKPRGTDFQQRVWSELTHIPWGECMTYAELAKRLGTAPRAVGGALRANPIPILIPCHRVVAASGLGGYAGASELGQVRKRWLLRHEGVAMA